MRFKGRTLKPYSEPVSASALIDGATYFMVHFFDTELLVPRLEPLVFIGRNLNSGDVSYCYFQDYDSHQRGLRFGATNARMMTDAKSVRSAELQRGTFLRQKDDALRFIFEYEHALELLMSCSLRRMGQAKSPSPR